MKKAPSTKKQPLKSASYEKAQLEETQLQEELDAAREQTALIRNVKGAFTGAIEAAPFTLPNPGGGAPLLENASLTLVRGKRYGLIGRNGKGKSTMLRALAARRVGSIPSNVSMHYVSQDVQLSEQMREKTAIDVVLAADIERALLLMEQTTLEACAELDEAAQVIF